MFRIDFSERSIWRVPGIGLFGIGLAALVVAAGLQIKLERSNLRLAAQINELKAGEEGTAAHTTIPPPDPIEEKRIVATDRALSVPWESLYQAIESAHIPTVTLLGIEPDPTNGAVRITGQALNYFEILGYVDRLANNGVLKDVTLLSHNVLADASDGPIHFALVARWTGP